MSNIKNWPQVGISDSQRVLSYDSSRSQGVSISISDILEAAANQILSEGGTVHGVDTLDEAISTDFESGIYVQTGGEAVLFDGGFGLYRVSDPGSGGTEMDNGNELVSLFSIGTNSGQIPTSDDVVLQSQLGMSDGDVPTANNAKLTIGSISDIPNLLPFDGMTVYRRGWHPSSNAGGDTLIYDASFDRSNHDGIKYFSPTVPYNSDASIYRSGSEEASSGAGCWVSESPQKLTPMHAGAVADGSTDDADAFEDWLLHLVSLQIDYYPSTHSGGTQDKSSSMAHYSLGGKSYGFSRQVQVPDLRYCVIDNGSIWALPGFVNPYLLDGSGFFQSDVTWGIGFFCNHLTDSYFASSHLRTKFTGVMWGFTTHNIYHNTNQRELLIEGAFIAQYLFGEDGYDDESNITAYACNLQGTDSVINDDTIIINTAGINMNAGGNYVGAHIYGPNLKPAVIIRDGAGNNTFKMYCDNSYVDYRGPINPNNFAGSRFFYNKDDATFTFFRIRPQVASLAISGLQLCECSFSSTAVDIDMCSVDTTDGGSVGRFNNSSRIENNIFPTKNGFSVSPFSTTVKVRRSVSAVTSSTFDLSSYVTQIPGADFRTAKSFFNSLLPVAHATTQISSGVTSIDVNFSASATGDILLEANMQYEEYDEI